MPPFGDYNSPGDVEFDPEGAAKLLAEAGYPGGAGLPKIDFLTTDRESAKRLGEALQAMWKKHLGIDISIQQMEWTSYLNTMIESDFDLASGGWIGDYIDPLTFLDMWVKDGGNNRTNWSSEAFEELLTRAEKPPRAEARLRLLEEAESLFLSDRPILPIYWYTRNYLFTPTSKAGIRCSSTTTHTNSSASSADRQKRCCASFSTGSDKVSSSSSPSTRSPSSSSGGCRATRSPNEKNISPRCART